MALTQRQMACFERNAQFLNEVAAALMPIATELKKQALVIRSNPASTETEQTFAAIWEQLADKILAEQGFTTQAGVSAATTATGGSVGMKYLVQQLLMSSGWTLTPDQWAADEPAARATIQAGMAALITSLTAMPGAEPEAPQAMAAAKSRRGTK